jgi:hypothetical protein
MSTIVPAAASGRFADAATVSEVGDGTASRMLAATFTFAFPKASAFRRALPQRLSSICSKGQHKLTRRHDSLGNLSSSRRNGIALSCGEQPRQARQRGQRRCNGFSVAVVEIGRSAGIPASKTKPTEPPMTFCSTHLRDGSARNIGST